MHSSVLSAYFTPPALLAAQQIPTIDGLMIDPFVVGVNGWSSLAGILLFNGCGRKVVISRDYLHQRGGIRTILHEYIHHLDDMDRDGGANWIDHREFALAFHRLMQDSSYEDDIEDYLDISDAFITNAFGVGPMSELIAYIGSWVAQGNGPAYMRRVFRKILLNCAEKKKDSVGIVVAAQIQQNRR
jgi:hypothetical protein